MARAISDEELQLKRRARRRLIGAIVLVTAIVVVLPMVLDSEPRPVSRDVSVRIPSTDSGTFTTKVAPLPAPKDAKPASKVSEIVVPAPGAVQQETPKATAKPAAGPSGTAKPAKAPPSRKDSKTAAKKAKPVSPLADGQFAVQVIALADAEKAKQIQQRIAGAGITAYTEIVKTAKGDVTRVRAGPYATREAAEKAKERLKALGMNGNITNR